MKGIYFYERKKNRDGANVGIEKKISQQIKCLKSLGDLMVAECVFMDSVAEKIKFLVPFLKSDREKRWKKLLDIVNEDTDYIYIRKPSLSIEFLAKASKLLSMLEI